MKTNINLLKKGDILSESSHYIVKNTGKSVELKHFESGQTVYIEDTYIEECINNADRYEQVVKVGKEDKKDGTPGIRTIFENIHGSQVFTVIFKKQDRPKTKKALEAEKEAQRADAVALIEKARKAKKSMATAYKEALEMIQNNPIKDYIEGEERTLRGYKLQFSSRDGKYKCMDMDITRSDKETGERFVNINTISQLIYNNIKYIVE